MEKKKERIPEGDLVPKVQHDAQPNVLERSRHQQLAIRGEAVTSRPRNHLGDLYAESGQTLQGSFSAVSKPNFASKYSLESSRRDLHNALLCTALESILEN